MARTHKRNCDHCNEYYEGYGAKFCKPACADASKIKPKWQPPEPDAILDWPLPVRPVEIHVHALERKPISLKRPYVSIHFSDIHFPFQCDRSLEVLYAIIQDMQPDLCVDHGDTLDCAQISKYQKDPNHRVDLQDEIEMAAAHFGRIRSIVPNAECWWFTGNHEDRLRRLIWGMAEDLPAAQVMRLPGLRDALKWETLLGLEKMGWQIHNTRKVLFDRLVLKHGDVVRKWSGFTAKGEWEKYGKSGMSGHTHRRGVFEHRDYNGQHAWWELGCLCDLDPSYMTDPDWANGFVVCTWSDDRKNFAVEEVRIHNGKAVFRGKLYDANVGLFKAAA